MTEHALAPPPDIPTIAHEELRARIRDRSITLVDVLGPESFALHHIPGAINIPFMELRTRAPVELPDKNARLAAYCASYT